MFGSSAYRVVAVGVSGRKRSSGRRGFGRPPTAIALSENHVAGRTWGLVLGNFRSSNRVEGHQALARAPNWAPSLLREPRSEASSSRRSGFDPAPECAHQWRRLEPLFRRNRQIRFGLKHRPFRFYRGAVQGQFERSCQPVDVGDRPDPLCPFAAEVDDVRDVVEALIRFRVRSRGRPPRFDVDGTPTAKAGLARACGAELRAGSRSSS
jgi:hypothetical protein